MYGVAQEINHYEVIRNNWKEMLGSEILKKYLWHLRERLQRVADKQPVVTLATETLHVPGVI